MFEVFERYSYLDCLYVFIIILILLSLIDWGSCFWIVVLMLILNVILDWFILVNGIFCCL